jgi:hypothetical protein
MRGSTDRMNMKTNEATREWRYEIGVHIAITGEPEVLFWPRGAESAPRLLARLLDQAVTRARVDHYSDPHPTGEFNASTYWFRVDEDAAALKALIGELEALKLLRWAHFGVKDWEEEPPIFRTHEPEGQLYSTATLVNFNVFICAEALRREEERLAALNSEYQRKKRDV